MNDYLICRTKDKRKVLESAMAYSINAPAKRLRPLLTLASFKMFNSKKVTPIMPLACAIEMVHTYSLIHDDLPAMDDDTLRRGKKTCHIVYGEDIAILAGDTLHSFAIEILARELPKYYDPKIILEALTILTNAFGVCGMAGGQVLDLKADANLSDPDYLIKTHALKTGAIISACITLPALLENASIADQDALHRFSQHLGLLFQITDDILDCEGGIELGKTPGKDLTQNKLTYISLFGLEKAKKLALNESEKAKNELSQISNKTLDLWFDIINFVLYRQV